MQYSKNTCAVLQLVPTLNFNATDYIDLLNWKDCNVTVPPILLDMSEEQLQGLVTVTCFIKNIACEQLEFCLNHCKL